MGSERPSEWIFDPEAMTLHCRECGEAFKFDDPDEALDFKEYARYCLRCGAWMGGHSCETCAHGPDDWDDEICDGCTTADDHWEAKL